MREHELLQHIYAANVHLPPRVTLPPGDDMGAVRLTGPDVLITVDQLADGVHFLLESAGLARVARKAITRNLSDVAAMAAQPVAAVAAACLPRDFGQQRGDELFDHLRRVAAQFDCPLIGGDVCVWDQRLLLTVTVLAEPWPGVAPLTRVGAQVGDHVYVSGALGGSLEEVAGRIHHLDFEPRIALAHALARDPALRPHCMLDLSDGLAVDLGRLCQAGGVRARVQVARLPLSAAATQAARRSGKPPWQHALGDGEDYELCMTCAHELPAEVAGVPLTEVGRIIAAPGDQEHAADPGSLVEIELPDGRLAGGRQLGWEHRGT